MGEVIVDEKTRVPLSAVWIAGTAVVILTSWLVGVSISASAANEKIDKLNATRDAAVVEYNRTLLRIDRRLGHIEGHLHIEEHQDLDN